MISLAKDRTPHSHVVRAHAPASSRREVHTLLHVVIGSSRRTRERVATGAGLVLATALVLLIAFAPLASASTLAGDLIDGRTAPARGVDLQALPDVTVAEGALIDGDGRMLWGRNPTAERPMASITKLMTAIVAVEHSSMNDVVVVPREAALIGQSSAGLYAGQKITMFELLEALLVKSGNDAAITIADHVGGTQAGFVDMMNAKARELGLTHTHYANPHGLDAPGHYTTATDLGVLARYAMAKPQIANIVDKKQITIGTGKWRRTLFSTDELLGVYQGAMGVKTGNTNGAGYSVVSAAQRGGVRLYAVVLGTKSDRQRFLDAKTLLDWGFAHYRPMSLATKGSVVGMATVSDYLDKTVQAVVSADTTVAVLDVDGTIKREVQVGTVPAPVEKGGTVGVITFKQGKEVIATVPLVSTEAVGKPNPFEALWIAIVRTWNHIF